jgi:hypothetical protein
VNHFAAKLSFVGLLVCASLPTATPASAQATSAMNTVGAHELHVSPVTGFNGSIAESAQHNSSTGWAYVTVPDVSYRFNEHFSVDASVPYYAALKAYVSSQAGATTQTLVSGHNVLGDTNLAGHFEITHKDFEDELTATLGLPTGNTRFGVGANTTTYNVTNHVENSFGLFTPDIEFGVGTNSMLAGAHVRENYTAVGLLANFQAGTAIDLPLGMNLDLEAYEELPIGNQNVYGTVSRTNKKNKVTTRQVLEGTGVAEDNGFTSELDVPLGSNKHFRLTGEYDRSLIQHLDTTSIGLTWTLRTPKINRE